MTFAYLSTPIKVNSYDSVVSNKDVGLSEITKDHAI